MSNSELNHNMILLARQLRGMTQKELAEKLNVSQAKLSKIEQNLFTGGKEFIKQLAESLDFPEAFFYQKGQIYPTELSLFRKKQSMPKRELEKINAQLNTQYLNLQKLMEAIDLDKSVPFYDLDDFDGSPSKVAQQLRRYLNLPRGPIENLTLTVESMGIIVLFVDVATLKFDGVHFMGNSNFSIIAINKHFPPDRQRFTLAHELGHLIMHQVYTSASEDEANEFASEFLIPSNDIVFPPRRIALQELANLKRYWKVSMQSLLIKAKKLEYVNSRQYSYLWSQMSKYGYRKREPKELDPPREKTNLIDTIFKIYIDELDYSIEDFLQTLILHDYDLSAFWGDYLPETKSEQKFKIVRGNLYYS